MKLTKKAYYLAGIMLCLFSGCSTGVDNSSQTPLTNEATKIDLQQRIVTLPIQGKVIYSDTISPPKKIPAGEPRTVPLKNNICISGNPQSFEIPSNVKIVIPGTNSLFKPDTLEVLKRKLIFKESDPVKALPPKFKDKAYLDVKCYDNGQEFEWGVIYDIIQDKNKNIWIVSGGLIKFDGTFFTRYNRFVSSGRYNICPRSLLEDSNGNFWFTRAGRDTCLYVFKYNGTDVTRFSLMNKNDSMKISHPNYIFEDISGNIWVSTYDRGVCKIVPANDNHPDGIFIHFTKNEGLISNRISCIAEDHNGNIWFGSRDSGLCKYEKVSDKYPQGRFIHYTSKEGLSNNSISSLYFDNNNKLWIGTHGGGINILDDNHFTRITTNEGLSSNFINNIIEDRSGSIWIGTHGGGVNKFNLESDSTLNGTIQHLTAENNLSSNHITSMLEDNNGLLWFGSQEEGLMAYNPNSFKHITPDMGMEFDFLRSPAEDFNGNLWFGEERGGGLCKFDGENFHYYTRKQGLCSDSVSSVIHDSDGNIWIGTLGAGLCMFDGGYFHHYDTSNGLNDNYISFLKEDKNRNIWIGTVNNGIYKFDGITFTRFSEKEGLCDNHVNYILEDEDSNIWIATDKGGIDRIDGDSVTNFSKENILTNNKVASLLEDQKGDIWFGVTGSLIRYNPNTNDTTLEYTEFRTKGGNIPAKHKNSLEILVNSNVKFLENHSENILIGTEKGINWLVIPKSGKPDNIQCIVFNKEDGLKGDNPIINANLINSKNQLLLGYKRALTTLNLNNFKPPKNKPVIGLNNLKLEQYFINYNKLSQNQNAGKSYYIGANNDIDLKNIQFTSVAPFQNYPENLVLPYNINHLTFNFSAIDWKAPHKLRYQYMLEGSDTDWRPITKKNTAIYTNLHHGEYTFKVKAIGIANKWSNVFNYDFVIRTPWWLTWWAYTIYGLIVISIFYAWRRYDLKRQKLKQDLELEHIQTEKLEELDKMKSRFFANISHEFRTPLTLILGPLQNLFSKSPDSETKQELGIMQRNARRLQKLINQLLSLSKLEAGKIKLTTKEENIVTLIRLFVQSFESYAAQKKIDLVFTSDQDEILIYIDRDKIEKTLNNLLSNAFKFTPAGGKIKVEINSKPTENKSLKPDDLQTKYLEIRITDTGQGIPPDRMEHIFDRFYQVGDSYAKDEEGSGIGLALTKELVELHYGIIKAESKPGKGSSFYVFLPYGKSHLKSDEIITRKDITDEYSDHDIYFPEDTEKIKAPTNNQTHPDKDTETPIILIVEDNSDLRFYIRGFLDHDYKVIEAKDGKDGLEKAIATIPDLIISDIMMPNMDGNQLCQEVKKDERTSHIPVILLTARASMESKIEGLETGADDFITKPFEPIELQVRIRNLIEQRKRLRIRYQKEASEEGKISIPEMPSMDQKFIKKAKSIVTENMSEPDFSIEDFAREAAMSRVQLHRKLRALVNQSASEFLMAIRLKRAAELLKQKTGNISEIAYDVGFNNPSYFTSNFTKHYGLSPSEYLKKNS